MSGVQGDLVLLSQAMDDLGFVLGAMDASLPEGSCEAVLLPVVVPVPVLVCPVAIQRHLRTDGQTGRETGRETDRQIGKEADSQTDRCNAV